jgi:hypothetical protein
MYCMQYGLPDFWIALIERILYPDVSHQGFGVKSVNLFLDNIC